MYRTVKYGFLALLVASPLMFGSVHPWAIGIVEIWILTLAALWLWAPTREKATLTLKQAWPFLPLAVFFALVAFQSFLLPKETVEFLAPNNARAWTQLDSLRIGDPRSVSLSLNPHATLFEGLKWFCYAVTAWLAFSLAGSKHGKENNDFVISVAYAVTFIGALISLIAIIQLGLGLKLIYGFFEPYHSNTFFGPYVNRNHFAGYLEMAIPLGIGLSGSLLMISNRTGSNSSKASRFGYVEIFIFLALSLVLMLAGLLLSVSRAGIIIGLLFITGQVLLTLHLMFRRISVEKLLGIGLVIMSSIIAVGIFTDWHKLEQRFASLPVDSLATNVRLIVYEDTFRMSHDYPMLGVGLGCYQYAFPQYKTWEFQGAFQHAHNDYLEILSETGYIGLVVYLSFLFSLLYFGYKFIKSIYLTSKTNADTSRMRDVIFIGLLGCVLCILCHSIFDFNLFVPSNHILFMSTCGIIISFS